MKLILFKIENEDQTFVEYDKCDFFEGFYDVYTKIVEYINIL